VAAALLVAHHNWMGARMADADWTAAYEAARDGFGLSEDALGTFAIQLAFNLDDLKELSAESIVGGGDDKKCDVFYYDQENGIVVIAQCYYSKKTEGEAPANKASDLNTAIGWILNAKIESVPESLRDRAAELRQALSEGLINQIQIWYVHNRQASKNVSDELATVADTAKIGVKQYIGLDTVSVVAKEVGFVEIANLYAQAEHAIIVTDEFEIPVSSYFTEAGEDWDAVSTVVNGNWLAEQFKKYGTDLFSANIRGYLGSRDVDANINNGIKRTANDEPSRFFVYNNGITALLLDFSISEGVMKFRGLSIVNGAQTTGSLANAAEALSESLRVPIRFVRARNEEVIEKIVKYNNSQNKIEAADYRSGDQIQQRLREEFASIPDAEYEGGRRGGVSDAIKRSKNTIPSYTIAQALAAFHGEPAVAYDRKSDLWKVDKNYNLIFNQETSARHMVFLFSLLENINNRRLRIIDKQKNDPEGLTGVEKGTLTFLNKKGSQFLLLFAMSQVLETIVAAPISSKFKLQFKANLSPAEAETKWDAVLDIMLPLNAYFDEAFSNGRILSEGVQVAVPKFAGVFAGLSGVHAEAFAKLAGELEFG
jgi:hypothetical protein